MAGDWIPVSLDLPRKREVLIIASRLKWSRYEVVGRLVEFWAWVSTESVDGRIDGLSVDVLASIHGFDRRFLGVLLDVGWLTQDEAGLIIPNFQRWLSHSAKRRLQAAERQRRARARDPCHANVTKMSRSQRDKSVTTEENSTEQYSTEDQIESSAGSSGSVKKRSSNVVDVVVDVVVDNEKLARVCEAWQQIAALWPVGRPPRRDIKLVLQLLVAALLHDRGWALAALRVTSERRPENPGAYLQKVSRELASREEYIWLRNLPIPPQIAELAKPPPKPTEATVPATGPPEGPPPEQRLGSVRDLIDRLKGAPM